LAPLPSAYGGHPLPQGEREIGMGIYYMKKIVPILVFLILAACGGGRIPTPKSAHSITQSFFKKYGKKYKTSVYGQGLKGVEIQGIREQSRNQADVEAYVTTSGGEKTHVLMTFKKAPPLGWKVQTWENLR
ncbi:MAG: hypothetical protein Q7T11_09300, partial [Deltaproteobacteria bacterium]|nr:hypothetical protein [Deltaproteobacteria bacterium]